MDLVHLQLVWPQTLIVIAQGELPVMHLCNFFIGPWCISRDQLSV